MSDQVPPSPLLAELLDAERPIPPIDACLHGRVLRGVERAGDLAAVAAAAGSTPAAPAAAVGTLSPWLLPAATAFVVGTLVGAGIHAAVSGGGDAASPAEPPQVGETEGTSDDPTVPTVVARRDEETVPPRPAVQPEPERIVEQAVEPPPGRHRARRRPVDRRQRGSVSAASGAPTPAAASLARERVLLDAARSALSRGRPADALQVLDGLAREMPDGQLAEDREVLAVEALRTLGRIDEAHARADRLRGSRSHGPPASDGREAGSP